MVIDILRTPINDADRRVWLDSGTGILTSCQAYDLLRSPLLHMPWASWIWAPFTPKLRSTTVLRATWRKLPTTNSLQRIGFSGATRCPLCLVASETQDHILSNCRFTHSLYDSMFDIFHIRLSYDMGFSSILLQAQQFAQNKQIKNLWRLPFVTTIWAIWHTRWKVIFEHITPSHHGCMIMILDMVREVSNFKMGAAFGIDDLAICRLLRGTKRASTSTSCCSCEMEATPSWLV